MPRRKLKAQVDKWKLDVRQCSGFQCKNKLPVEETKHHMCKSCFNERKFKQYIAGGHISSHRIQGPAGKHEAQKAKDGRTSTETELRVEEANEVMIPRLVNSAASAAASECAKVRLEKIEETLDKHRTELRATLRGRKREKTVIEDALALFDAANNVDKFLKKVPQAKSAAKRR